MFGRIPGIVRRALHLPSPESAVPARPTTLMPPTSADPAGIHAYATQLIRRSERSPIYAGLVAIADRNLRSAVATEVIRTHPTRLPPWKFEWEIARGETADRSNQLLYRHLERWHAMLTPRERAELLFLQYRPWNKSLPLQRPTDRQVETAINLAFSSADLARLGPYKVVLGRPEGRPFEWRIFLDVQRPGSAPVRAAHLDLRWDAEGDLGRWTVAAAGTMANRPRA